MTSAPAPSPATNPPRRASKGSEASSGSSALVRRRQIREAGDADGAHGLLRAAHERRVDVAVADVAQRRADAVGAGGAGGHHVQALAAHAVADGQVARRDVPDHRGNEQRASRAWGPSPPRWRSSSAARRCRRCRCRTRTAMRSRFSSVDVPSRTGPAPRRPRRWRTARSARSGAPPSWSGRARRRRNRAPRRRCAPPYSLVSKRSMGAMQQPRSMSVSHSASTPTPAGVTAPTPVMTTRWVPSGRRVWLRFVLAHRDIPPSTQMT